MMYAFKGARAAFMVFRAEAVIHFRARQVLACRILAVKSACLLDIRPPRPSEALQAAEAAVLLQPDEPMHWIAKMNALRSSGNIAAAISDAKHIAELDPDLGRDLPEVLEKLQQSRTANSSKQGDMTFFVLSIITHCSQHSASSVHHCGHKPDV
jgi:hypothetical protein